MNKNVDLYGLEKERSYNNLTSLTAVSTAQEATVFFGTGTLEGHFVYDDLRIGSCDG